MAWQEAWRLTAPPVNRQGSAAAAYLVNWTQTVNRKQRVSCAADVCTVWLLGGNQGPRTMYLSLGSDLGFFTSDSGPGHPTNIRQWTFHLTTTRGVLTARCTTDQANRIEGTISPALVKRWCPTSWVPHGA